MLRACDGVRREKGRVGVRFIQITEDRQALGQTPPVIELEYGHLTQRVALEVFGRFLFPSASDQMDGDMLDLDAFQVEPDTHPPGSGAPPVSVEFQEGAPTT